MQEMIELKEKFEKIRNVGWIKERRKGPSSIGYTFEEMLGKGEDEFPLPDYRNIEIKAHNKNSKRLIHLFNLTPDGDYLFPIKRIIDILGYIDKDGYKIFYRSFNAKNITKIIYGRQGRIIVDRLNKKIKMVVLDNKNNDINLGISWSFDYLEKRLMLKLKYLALVIASSCIICGEGYYHYESITFYKLKDFNSFVNAIDNGVIDITFKIDVHKELNKLGKTYDHGTDFAIDISNLHEIYEEIKI